MKQFDKRILWSVIFIVVLLALRLLTHPHLTNPDKLVWKSYTPIERSRTDSTSAAAKHAASVTSR
jgi:hypothetical protein